MPESNKLALVSDATAALQTTSSLPSNKCITYQEMLDMIESAGGGGNFEILPDDYSWGGGTGMLKTHVRIFNMSYSSYVRLRGVDGTIVGPSETKDCTYNVMLTGTQYLQRCSSSGADGNFSGQVLSVAFRYYNPDGTDIYTRWILEDWSSETSGQYTTSMLELKSDGKTHNVFVFAYE